MFHIPVDVFAADLSWLVWLWFPPGACELLHVAIRVSSCPYASPIFQRFARTTRGFLSLRGEKRENLAASLSSLLCPLSSLRGKKNLGPEFARELPPPPPPPTQKNITKYSRPLSPPPPPQIYIYIYIYLPLVMQLCTDSNLCVEYFRARFLSFSSIACLSSRQARIRIRYLCCLGTKVNVAIFGCRSLCNCRPLCNWSSDTCDFVLTQLLLVLKQKTEQLIYHCLQN